MSDEWSDDGDDWDFDDSPGEGEEAEGDGWEISIESDYAGEGWDEEESSASHLRMHARTSLERGEYGFVPTRHTGSQKGNATAHSRVMCGRKRYRLGDCVFRALVCREMP